MIHLTHTGDSMFPIIKSGDTLVVDIWEQPKKIETLTPGDVILVKDTDEWIVHRVVEFGNVKKLKGDNSIYFDSDLSQYAWGTVKNIKRNNTSISNFNISLVTKLSQLNTYLYPGVLRRLARAGLRIIAFHMRLVSKKERITEDLLDWVQPSSATSHELTPEGVRLLQEHQLGGFIYSKNHISSQSSPLLKSTWKTQFIKNEFLLKELELLGLEFKSQNLEVTLLKGASLIKTIYSDSGSRFMSDIDLFVSTQNFEQLKKTLIQAGFSESPSKGWAANHYKSIWTKKTESVDILLEIHTQLIWTEPKGWQWRTEPHHLSGFNCLSPNHQLLHLCLHLAYQHNFLKLFWLIDIQLFLKQNIRKINFDTLFWEARQLRVLTSLKIVFWTLSHFFNDTWSALPVKSVEKMKPFFQMSFKEQFLKQMINMTFLVYPTKNYLKYLLIKFLLKDTLTDAVQYIRGWTRAHLKNIISKSA